jgi:hypothetical protein
METWQFDMAIMYYGEKTVRRGGKIKDGLTGGADVKLPGVSRP